MKFSFGSISLSYTPHAHTRKHTHAHTHTHTHTSTHTHHALTTHPTILSAILLENVTHLQRETNMKFSFGSTSLSDTPQAHTHTKHTHSRTQQTHSKHTPRIPNLRLRSMDGWNSWKTRQKRFNIKLTTTLSLSEKSWLSLQLCRTCHSHLKVVHGVCVCVCVCVCECVCVWYVYA